MTTRQHAPTCARLQRPAPGTHFADPAATEAHFAAPIPCSHCPQVALVGLAMTPTGGPALVIDAPGARAHFGPDTTTVTRRALLLCAALTARGVRYADALEATVWVLTLWADLSGETAAAMAELDPTGADPTRTPTPDAVERTTRAVLAALT